MPGSFPGNFDPTYFCADPWPTRLGAWIAAASNGNSGFASANAASIARILNDPRTSVRVVINIRPHALLRFLDEGRYRNVYELPEIGGHAPDQNRRDADAKLGTGSGHWFAAAAMGGVGIRYYGEYCMVLKSDFTDATTQIFDRDSYDVLFPPLDNLPNSNIDCLKGAWGPDVAAMISLRVLPDLNHHRQIVTSGTIIELALKDQEFVEVHLSKAIQPADIDQVVEAPETAAMETRILERQRNGMPPAMHELEWVRRRAEVILRLNEHGIRHRIITQHGRGFQWR